MGENRLREPLHVSIVMPVYNARDHLAKTLASVQGLAFEDFELILVNDGSTDDTLEILNQYAAADPRFRVVTIENGGPANARNVGISLARGKYLFFMDSDDTIAPETFSILLPKAASSDPEVIIFGFQIVRAGHKGTFRYHYKPMAITSREELGAVLSDLYVSNVLNQVWNKLYLTELVKGNGITFTDYRYGEDRIFVFDILRVASRVLVTDECLYHYHMNETESLITKFYDRKFEACLKIDQHLRALADSCRATTSLDLERYDYMFMKSVVSCLTNLFSSHCPYDRPTKRDQIRRIVTHENVRRSAAARIGASRYFALVQQTVASRNVTLNYAMAGAITRISNSAPRLFVKIKHDK